MVEFITPPFIDGLKCEEDVRRVASAFIVLQNAVKTLTDAKLDEGDVFGAFEFQDVAANGGAECQNAVTAVLYELTGYNVQKFIDEQAADGRECYEEAARSLAEAYPEVVPK